MALNSINFLLFLGAVVDFISVTIFGYKFAVFNIADMGITCGVAIYLISCIIKEKKEKNSVLGEINYRI